MRARLDEYAAFHRTWGNEVCHYLGVPLIVLGVGGLLGMVRLGADAAFPFSLTEVALVAVGTFYLVEARALGVVTTLAIVILSELGHALPVAIGLLAFFIGWAVQFVGHARYEHRSPAFVRNLLHLLVGPAWLVERLLFTKR
jgi:uncharacterized membrane protein YGL010W